MTTVHFAATVVSVTIIIKLRRKRWAGPVARMVENGVYRVSVVKPEGKVPPERPWRRWEGNIKMDHQDVVCGGLEWMDLAQDLPLIDQLVKQ